MYARMMMASRRLAELSGATAGLPSSSSGATAGLSSSSSDQLHYARQALYRGQCNCPYWHGAFGGIYLPHLRNAIYNQLIACDNLIDRATGKPTSYVEAT